jgi:hypothetical protein
MPLPQRFRNGSGLQVNGFWSGAPPLETELRPKSVQVPELLQARRGFWQLIEQACQKPILHDRNPQRVADRLLHQDMCPDKHAMNRCGKQDCAGAGRRDPTESEEVPTGIS